MKKRIMTEAAGSLVANWLIKAIKESGNIAVASDINPESVGLFLADSFVIVPSAKDPLLWDKMVRLLIEEKIDIVIPSLDETLHLWAIHRDELAKQYGIRVVISDLETIDTFLDKYQTFLFFKKNEIPTPKTSLKQEYPLLKPRFGRGGKGISIVEDKVASMDGLISQELLKGQEYTIDCLVDHQANPVYIVPRKRLCVKEGKSVNGEVVDYPEIKDYVEMICGSIRFFGPINIQCFETDNGIIFTEINPRIGGGMALGLAATENWVRLIVEKSLKNIPISPKPIQYGLRMYRYYEEIFV